ncbi:MAG: hemolysin family protein [Caldilineaceae bacterium]
MESDPLPWTILAITLLLTALTSALELSFTTVNRSDIRRNVERGIVNAQLLDELLSQTPTLFLSLNLLKNMGVVCSGAASAWIVLTSTNLWVVMTLVLMLWILLALLQPLWRAALLARADTLAYAMAPTAKWLTVLLRPLTVPILQLYTWTNPLDAKVHEDSSALTDDALRMLMSPTDNPEDIEENEREMIASILEMNETVAREVMVPRIDMVAMSVETTLRESLDIIIAAGHSRIPVYEENIDHIIGLLYAKDLLRCFRDNETEMPIRALLRPAYFIPDSKKVDALFQDMQKHRVHIAMVVDEYGGTAGLVTIEDIIEEIVGDIQDEYDIEEDTYIEAIGANAYLLNSRLDLYSLSKLLDIELDTDAADTLGGLIYTLMEHVPEQGEYVEHQGWRFTVIALDGRRIEQVRAEPLHPLSLDPMEQVEQAQRSAFGSPAAGQSAAGQPAAQRSVNNNDSLVNIHAAD